MLVLNPRADIAISGKAVIAGKQFDHWSLFASQPTQPPPNNHAALDSYPEAASWNAAAVTGERVRGPAFRRPFLATRPWLWNKEPLVVGGLRGSVLLSCASWYRS